MSSVIINVLKFDAIVFIFCLMSFAFCLRPSGVMIGLTGTAALSQSPFLSGTLFSNSAYLGPEEACEIFSHIFFRLAVESYTEGLVEISAMMCRFQVKAKVI